MRKVVAIDTCSHGVPHNMFRQKETAPIRLGWATTELATFRVEKVKATAWPRSTARVVETVAAAGGARTGLETPSDEGRCDVSTMPLLTQEHEV